MDSGATDEEEDVTDDTTWIAIVHGSSDLIQYLDNDLVPTEDDTASTNSGKYKLEDSTFLYELFDFYDEKPHNLAMVLEDMEE